MATAIHHIEYHHTVGARSRLRPQDANVRRKFHQPARITRRKFQIDDDGVTRVVRVQREMRATFDPFVSASRAVAAPPEQVCGFADVNADDFGCGVRRTEQCQPTAGTE